MKNRRFNLIMPAVNHRWLAYVLNMQVAPDTHLGPDLVDKHKIVEAKFKLVAPTGYTHRHWTVYEGQSNYNNGRHAYWALSTYTLDRPVSKIRLQDVPELEKMVQQRDVWLVDWDWMDQFQLYAQHVKRDSKWYDQKRRYAKSSKLPKVDSSIKVHKGTVNITEGIDPRVFQINSAKPAWA